jgi:hypothetical protein
MAASHDAALKPWPLDTRAVDCLVKKVPAPRGPHSASSWSPFQRPDWVGLVEFLRICLLNMRKLGDAKGEGHRMRLTPPSAAESPSAGLDS